MSVSVNNPNTTKWYALRVVSGKEKKIQEMITHYMHRDWVEEEWANDVRNVLLPTEKVYKIQRGKKVASERNRYPGYLIMEIKTYQRDKASGINDDLRDAISNLPDVIHFLGKASPTPLRDDEVSKMMGKIDEMAEHATILEEIPEKGEAIKIIEGVFNGFNGIIEEVNKEKKRVKVIIKIFGKETVAELSLFEIDRVT